jgi:Helix-turn-helix domain
MSRQSPPLYAHLNGARPATAALSSPVLANHLSTAQSALLRLNEKQLAERWGVSVRTLQAARVKGNGVPFIRIGRAVRYRIEDVLAYEQARLRTNTSEAL